MPVTAKYRADVEDRLAAVLPITTKCMFGGVGVYAGAHFFAIVYNDEVYFRVDDAARPEYETRGAKPFQPFEKQGGICTYYAVPKSVLDDPTLLRTWAHRAVDAAKRKRKPRSRSPRRKIP